MTISKINSFSSIDYALLQSKECLIFDMDGTLIQTENLNYMIYKTVLKKLFNVLISQEDWKDFFSGRRLQDSIPQYLISIGLSSIDFKVSDFINIAKPIKEDLVFNHLMQNSSITPGVLEFLGLMKQQNKMMILASSTIKIFCINMLEQYNLFDFFDHILTAEDVVLGKPNPEIYIKAKELSNHQKDECLVFEDSINGIIAAELAGIEVIKVINNY